MLDKEVQIKKFCFGTEFVITNWTVPKQIYEVKWGYKYHPLVSGHKYEMSKIVA